ncbi:MAG TPA: MFS transporter [Gemmatimonadales bacterium]|nr:MFS transporter [Gemmatimonadales bacterium]
MTDLRDRPQAALERATIGRVSRRLIPFMFVLFVANYLDRVNVSFAALQMNRDLAFSGAAYGFGAGMFFLGYCLFQLPSNLLLQRIGARRWIGALAIGWGVVAVCMMFVRDRTGFFVLRFVLGAVEAGFFPGMILYLTRWFPARERARATARFMAAVPIAQIIGGPISGALLGLQGVAGLAGWQWLFLIEGLPSIALGGCVFVWLADRPEDAAWLPAAERDWLLDELRREAPLAAASPPGSRDLLSSPSLWWLGVLWLLIVLVGYGQLLWLPQLIKGADKDIGNFTVGVLSIVPPLVAAFVMVRVAALSDRTGERRGYVAGACLVSAAGFLASAAALHSPLLATAALSIVAIGIAASFGPFWSLATTALPAGTAVVGAAIISSIGSLGGFAGPYAVGLAKDATGGFSGALVWFAVLSGIAAVLARFTPLGRTAGSAAARSAP